MMGKLYVNIITTWMLMFVRHLFWLGVHITYLTVIMCNIFIQKIVDMYSTYTLCI